jgi:pimeloyl-ACP methyl ester carboxylesterase
LGWAGIELGGVLTLAAQYNGAIQAVQGLHGVPKVFYHGVDDKMLPCQTARDLHKHSASPAELRVLEDCGHDFLPYKDTLLDELHEWVVQRGLAAVTPENRRGRHRGREEENESVPPSSTIAPASSEASLSSRPSSPGFLDPCSEIA